jgi:5-amino-6-(5-phosphoribosylamino)uracil reductase/diaminohydroxyphosphoribosylaminopyrimidine deaminase/5-amino-6-(5-phosphoribosylamino)uracil reductase
VHYAQTLDGRIATRTGNSQWISGDESLRLAHELRAAHQAVMVGIGTVLADNPKLTVRLVPGRSPLRVVADSTLRIPAEMHLLSDGAAETLIATTTRAPAERVIELKRQGARVMVLEPDEDGRVDLAHLLAHLRAEGVESVLVEGGGCLITSALSAGVVDRLVACIAPKVVGAGIDAVGDLNIQRLADAVTFSSASFTPLGCDMIFDGRVEHPRQADRRPEPAAAPSRGGG